jgi:Tol biopolymer transport system component
VRGVAVDHRADIFSLGVVLYEMLAGRRAFHRDTVAGTLAAIVETDPPSSSGDGSAASQRLMRLVRRCLEKAPAQRFQSARDLAHVLADESGDEPLDAAASGSRRFQWRPIAITALLTTAVIAGFALWVWPGLGRDTAPPAQGPVEIEVAAPEGTAGLMGPVLSNDGRRLAFVAGGRIYIRDTAARTARLLDGTDGAAYPFFSPDGRRIAFFASGQLKIAPVDDGAPFVVCQTGLIRGGTWTDDDAIVFAENGKGLSQVSPSAGATPTALTSLNTDEKDHRAPHALPNAAGIVFTLNYQAGGYGVGAVKTGADRHVVVLKRGATPKYGAGQMFFVSENEELASAPFDIRSLKVTGPVVVHPERPTTAFNLGAFAYTVARDGTLAYQPFVPAQRLLSIVGRDLTVQPFGKPGAYLGPRASPDGSRIAVTVQPRTDWGDVWIGDERGSFQPLTTDGVSRFPVWDSTGTRVGVESRREGHEATWIHDVGNRSARKVFAGPAYPVALLGDGGVLLGRYNIPNRPLDELYLLRPGAETAEPLPLAVTRSAYGRISPDSRWFAYTNQDSNQLEVYVTAYPPGGRRWQVSQAGSGQRLAWAKSGSDLYFLRNDGEVMVVSIGPSGPTGGPRSAGVGKFPLGGAGPGDPQYDTLPDGRFVVVRDVAESSPTQPIIVVLNRVPAAPR